jgi:ferredoxin
VSDPSLAFAAQPAAAESGPSGTERIQEAIDTCPVDCIHWVAYEELNGLAEQLSQQDIQPLGLPTPARLKRTLPRRQAG